MSEVQIYDTIVNPAEPTYKEKVIELALASGCGAVLSREALLARAGALGIDQGWAGTVIDGHMNCIRTEEGLIYVDNLPSENEVMRWRNSRVGSVPDICRVGREGKPCLSSPSEARSRCPALYGNQLEIDMQTVEGERVKIVDGKRFDFATLVIGDAPLLETYAVGRSNEAIISCDPLMKLEIARKLNALLKNNDTEGKLMGLRQVLSGWYTNVVRDSGEEIPLEIMDTYKKLRGRRTNVFLVRGTYKGIRVTEGFFNRIIYSMPDFKNSEVDIRNLLDFAELNLDKNGLLIFRTNSEAYSNDMSLEIRRRAGIFEPQDDERYSFPPTLHEIYFKKAQGDAIHNIVVRKL